MGQSRGLLKRPESRFTGQLSGHLGRRTGQVQGLRHVGHGRNGCVRGHAEDGVDPQVAGRRQDTRYVGGTAVYILMPERMSDVVREIIYRNDVGSQF